VSVTLIAESFERKTREERGRKREKKRIERQARNRKRPALVGENDPERIVASV